MPEDVFYEAGKLRSGARLAGVLVKMLSAWLYSVSVSHLILQINRLPLSLVMTGIVCLMVLSLLAALTWQRYSLLALSAAAVILVIAVFWAESEWTEIVSRTASRSAQWFQWAFESLSGRTSGTSAQLRGLAAAICAAVSVFSYLAAARFNQPFLLAALLVATGILGSYLTDLQVIPWVVAGSFPVIAAVARNQVRTYGPLGKRRHVQQSRFMLQSVPLTAIALAIAVWLGTSLTAVPGSSQIRDLADDLSDLSVFHTTVIRSVPVFTIGSLGFMPLGKRLGGPVILSDKPLFSVTGYPQSMLLRGSVSTNYDGQSWLPDYDGQSWRLGSPLYASEQKKIFCLELPDFERHREDPEDAMETITYAITLINGTTRLIFYDGRPVLVKGPGDTDRKFYFESSGIIFMDHALQRGDTFTVEARRLWPDIAMIGRLANLCGQSMTDEERALDDAMFERYQQMPDLPEYGVSGDLTVLVRTLTDGLDNPFERCLVLKEYLASICLYNLDVAVPPEDKEFVSWFLESKEGYCVYFATALTMMCRIADIPARYIEGYYAPSSKAANGYRVVAADMAHAWVEIYLGGLGWVAVDATPGGPSSHDAVTPTPAVTTAPSPTSAVLTPTLPPASPRPTVTPDPDKEETRTEWMLPAAFLLFLLTILALYLWFSVYRFKKRHQPSWLRRHFGDDLKVVRFYWLEFQRIFQGLGLRRGASETPRQFFDRIRSITAWLEGKEAESENALNEIERAIYSGHAPDDAAMSHLSGFYDHLENLLRAKRNIVFFAAARVLRPGLLTDHGPDEQET